MPSADSNLTSFDVIHHCEHLAEVKQLDISTINQELLLLLKKA
jgi:hypothetical protein